MAVAKPLANYDIAKVTSIKSFIVQASGDCYSEHQYAECNYAECHYAECRYAEWH